MPGQENRTDSLEISTSDPSKKDPLDNASCKRTTAQYLEDVAARAVGHISDREWDHPDFQTYFADDYVATMEYWEQPMARSRDEYLAKYRAFVEANPNYAMEMMNISADVDEKLGSAVIWMHIRVKGHPANVWRESVTVSYWKKRNGRWIAHKQTGIRGVGL